MLFKQANSRISTPQLNRLIRAALENHEPAMYQMKRPKIYYATQIGVAPPTMIAVCNQPLGFSGPYQRYLLTYLRDHLPFGEVPVKLYLQQRARDDERDEVKLDKPELLAEEDDPTPDVDDESAIEESELDDDQLEEIEMVDEEDTGR
jgi:GTP-binding protein